MTRAIALAGTLALLVAAGCANDSGQLATATPDAPATASPGAPQTATPDPPGTSAPPAPPTTTPPAPPTATPSPLESASPDAGDGVCAESHEGETTDGEPVIVCARVHDARPYVRPPADMVGDGGPSTLYLAALNSEYSGFIGRDGTRYLTVRADGRPLATDDLPASLRAPSKRHLYLIYRVTAVLEPLVGDENDPPFTAAIHIEEAVPAILLEGRAIDGAFLGPWEGTVSERADDESCVLTVPCWDPERQVPLRVSFDTLEQMENIGVLEPNPLLADAERFAMVGAVENVTEPVVSSEGTCMAALDALGDANPFHPSTNGELRLYRYPAMHVPTDDNLVLDYPADVEGLRGANGMSALNVLHPANFLLEAEDAAWNSISIHNHGVPNGNEINLHPVTGGGGPCSP